MAQIKMEIVEQFGVISEGKWTRELNLVSWNGRKEPCDIRGWSLSHDICSKGITLNIEELRALKEILNEMDIQEV